MSKKLETFYQLFFLQFLNLTTNVDQCIKEIDESFFSKSIRLVILQTEEHKTEITHFAEDIIRLISEKKLRDLEIEERYIADVAESTRLGPSRIHLVITWNAQTLQKFLNRSAGVVVPVARDIYYFFFVSKTPNQELFFTRFWSEFGILHVNLCSNGNRYKYIPFAKNGDGTWGTVSTDSNTTLRKFNKHPLKISMFLRDRTSMLEMPKLLKFNPAHASVNHSQPSLVGLDGSMLRTMSEYLNFDVKFVGGLGQENFGFVLPHGTITGSLGVIARGRAQISTNGRFLMDYGTNDIEFTVPYDSDKMCAIVPRAKKVPLWLTIFLCFNSMTWSSTYVTYFVCTIFWYFVGPRNVSRATWEMCSIFHGIPVRIVPRLAQAFFLMWCMVFSIIITGLIQGSFFNSITTPYFYKEINTLEELDLSDLPIATNFYRFDSDDNVLTGNLRKKIVKSVPNLLDLIAFNRSISLLQRKSDVDNYIKTHYLEEDGTPLLHIVNECLTSYFISYIVPRGSGLLEIFNEAILRLFESGLTLKWYQDVEYSIMLEYLINLYSRSKTLWKPFNLYELQTAFFLWIVGLGASTLTVLCEKCLHVITARLNN